MNEDATPRGERPEDQEPDSASSRSGPDLSNELRDMGQQLEAAFRAALESDRAKQLQRDLAGGMRELSTQIQSALKSVQSNPRVQQAEERGRQVFAQARESKVVQDLQDTLVGGIAQLNDQLRKLVDRLETDGGTTSSTPTQQVPIEHDPATGETTRLDDEGKVGP
jgi:hypothetical protein